MGSKIYPAGRFELETGVQELEHGKFQGVVWIRENTGSDVKESAYLCDHVRASAAEAQADAERYAAVRQQQQALNE